MWEEGHREVPPYPDYVVPTMLKSRVLNKV